MLTLKEMTALLPETADSGYDSLAVSSDHFQRLVKASDDRDSWLKAPDRTAHTFGGIMVRSNPGVPDGLAIMMCDGKPVGIINFKEGTVKLTAA